MKEIGVPHVKPMGRLTEVGGAMTVGRYVEGGELGMRSYCDGEDSLFETAAEYLCLKRYGDVGE